VRTSIELPDAIYYEGERLARAKGYTLEQLIVNVLERELSQKEPSLQSHNRVSLPLIHSQNPGTLDLTNFDFDDLLA
jgi:predicted DNA-binding ribbon-helix-helix protein